MKNALYFFIFAIVLFSCKPKDPKKCSDCPVPADENVDLTFKFNTLYNNASIDWTKLYKTTAGDTVKFAKLKYLFSNFTLEKSNGELVKIKDAYGFISLSEKIDSFVIKNVPKGEYKSLRLDAGIDPEINHGNPQQWGLNHPLNPSVNDMHWGWSGGYIFNVVEGYYKLNGADNAFSFHTALDKNTRKHTLNYIYIVSKNSTFTLDIHADKYFSNAVNFSLKNDGAFTHSGEIDPVMDKFLQNVNGTIAIKDFK